MSSDVEQQDFRDDKDVFGDKTDPPQYPVFCYKPEEEDFKIGIARVPLILLHDVASVLREGTSQCDRQLLPRAWIRAIAHHFPDTPLGRLRAINPSLLPAWLKEEWQSYDVRTHKHDAPVSFLVWLELTWADLSFPRRQSLYSWTTLKCIACYESIPHPTQLSPGRPVAESISQNTFYNRYRSPTICNAGCIPHHPGLIDEFCIYAPRWVCLSLIPSGPSILSGPRRTIPATCTWHLQWVCQRH
jgi:hypothetical protein